MFRGLAIFVDVAIIIRSAFTGAYAVGAPLVPRFSGPVEVGVRVQVASVRGTVVGGPVLVEGAVLAVGVAVAVVFAVLDFAAAGPAEDDVVAHCGCGLDGLWMLFGCCLDAVWMLFGCCFRSSLNNCLDAGYWLIDDGLQDEGRGLT